MKVVIFSPGKSSHTHKWAMYYLGQGIDVTVVTFKDHYSEENAQQVKTVMLPKLLPGKLSYIPSVLALRKLLREIKPDILHAHFISSYGFVGALANYHPFFVSVWGTDIYQFPKKNKVNKKIVEFTLERANVICSTSRSMSEETAKYTKKQIEVTPFGVNLGLFFHVDKPTKEGLTIGIAKGLEDIYGFRDLFLAFAKLKTKYDNLELLIIGDGPMRSEYEEVCLALNIKDAVRFIGRIPNIEVADYMRTIDIVALPSYEDSFGVTAVEAMACGIPVVVSDVEGLKEVVIDNETGIVVPKGNPEAFAKAIENLLKDTSHRMEMGKKGIEHVRQNYNWDENAAYMIHLYKKELSKNKFDKI